MRNGISEGAIVQHLAKLRSRMVSAGLDVPPPLRRGGAAAPSKLHAKTAKVSEETEIKIESSDDEDGDSMGIEMHKKKPKDKKKRQTRKRKSKSRSKSVKSEDSDESTDTSDKEDTASESGSSQKSDNSSEYVAAGAAFLEYPNDTEYGMANNVSPPPLATRPRKLVKLRLPPFYLQQIARNGKIEESQTSNVEMGDGVNTGQQEVHRPGHSFQVIQPMAIEAAHLEQQQMGPQFPVWQAINGTSHALQVPQQDMTQFPTNYNSFDNEINSIMGYLTSHANAFPTQFTDQPHMTYGNMQALSSFQPTEAAGMINQGESREGVAPWMDNSQGSDERQPETTFMDDIEHPSFDNAIDRESENIFGMGNNSM